MRATAFLRGLQKPAQAMLAIWVGIACVLLAIAAYWSVLLDSHQTQRRFIASQSWLRVGQMAHAVSVQVQTLLAGLDYTMRGLESEYQDGRAEDFQRAIQNTFDAYPAGTFLQIAVADAQGDIVYSNLQAGTAPAPRVSIRDREHFRVHENREVMGTYIGRPVQGRVSGLWTIQLSRALYRGGRFSGVLVMSLSPDYILRYFQTIFEGPRDVVLLLREDGAYLARTLRQEDVIGHFVPERFLPIFAADQTEGRYETAAPVDGVTRLYAWSRVSGYPLIVVTGLDRQAIFGPLDASLNQSLLRNAGGSAVLLLGSLLTLWLAHQRRLSEQLRLKGERRFARMAQEVPGGLFQFHVDAWGHFRLPFTTPAFFALHGAQPSGSLPADNDLLQRVHPDDRAALVAAVRASVDAQAVWEHKYRVLTASGEPRWLHGHARPQREEDGTLIWHGYVHDITQDQAMQETIRVSEERLRLTMGAVRDGLWHWDCRSGHVEWDARCYEMLGFGDQAFAMDFETFCDMVHPADRARVRERLRQHVDDGGDYRLEMRLRTAQDGWLWVESRGEVTQRRTDGQPERMLGTHTDIQQRIEQSRLIKALLDRGSALVVMAGPHREILYANERALQAFQIDTRRLPGGVPLRALHVSDDSFERFNQLYAQLKAQGTVRTEWILRMPSGAGHWFDMQGSLLDPEADDGHVIWTMIDTDARRRAETALAQTQRRLEAIIDRFPAGILVTDANGLQIIATNRMLGTVLRLETAAEALKGATMVALLRQLPPPVSHALTQDAGASGRSLHALPGGHYVEIEGVPLRDDGQSIGHCWVLHDATERRRRESRLETLALTDVLTGIPNRRAFLERLDMEMAHLHSGLVPSSVLILLDIDHFKRVNDSYGHAVGDIVIKDLVATLCHGLRKQDMAGRLGGEEFVLLLSGADAESGLHRAQQLRTMAQARRVDAGKAGVLRYTISLGVHAMEPGDTSAEACLERADVALYYAKRHGRNQATLWTEDLPAIEKA